MKLLTSPRPAPFLMLTPLFPQATLPAPICVSRLGDPTAPGLLPIHERRSPLLSYLTSMLPLPLPLVRFLLMESTPLPSTPITLPRLPLRWDSYHRNHRNRQRPSRKNGNQKLRGRSDWAMTASTFNLRNLGMVLCPRRHMDTALAMGK